MSATAFNDKISAEEQPPCGPVSRELALVELNKKAAIDNTKARMTSPVFHGAPLAAVIRSNFLGTHALLAQETTCMLCAITLARLLP